MAPKSELVVAKAQFRSRYRMIKDYYQTMIKSSPAVTASIAYRQCKLYRDGFLKAYETILQHETEFTDQDEWNQYHTQFSEVNEILIQMEQLMSADQHQESGKSVDLPSDQHPVKAKLPFIELPKFSGHLMEWLSYSDLFHSLVHLRSDISDSEKHYYLRASVTGEALSVIQHLPMDGASYEMAFKLLKARYDNTRQLTDSYISRIMNLPAVSDSSQLRKQFYDPLRESTQALDKLAMPVSEWSYLLVFLILQKLPVDVRRTFEERYGKNTSVLPTFTQLMEVLDEQCRISTQMQDQPRRTNTGAASSSATESPRRGVVTRGPGRTVAQVSDHQIPKVCSYCTSSDHGLYRCIEFLTLPPKGRKSWALKSGHCFRCLRKHYARECAAKNWCKHCKSEDHNTLLCVEDSAHNRARAYQGRRSPVSPRPVHQSAPHSQEQVRSQVTDHATVTLQDQAQSKQHNCSTQFFDRNTYVKPSDVSFRHRTVWPLNMEKVINNLSCEKAPGLDGIRVKDIKYIRK